MTIQELKRYLSPDSIDQVATLVGHLQLRGYDAELLVPEVEDISLKERVRRANKITCQIGHPVQETIIISIHVDGIENFIIRRNHEPL